MSPKVYLRFDVSRMMAAIPATKAIAATAGPALISGTCGETAHAGDAANAITVAVIKTLIPTSQIRVQPYADFQHCANAYRHRLR